MNNKKNYLVIGAIVLVAILIVFLGINKKNQSSDSGNNPSNTPNGANEPSTLEEKYVGVYGAKVNGKYDNYEVILYLRNDGTFRESIIKESIRDFVGTYSVSGNTILLDTKAIYDSNGCYFKPGSILNNELFTTTTLIIENDTTINNNYEEDVFNVNAGYSEKENADSLKLYSVTPSDSDKYTDCSNKGKI